MRTLIENIDLFSMKISFNYRKKTVFHSLFGLSMSFGLYAIMIYFVYYFSKDFVKGTNPRVTFRETQFEEKFNYTINNIFSRLALHIQINETLFPNKDNFIKQNNNSLFLSSLFTLKFNTKNLIDGSETIMEFDTNQTKIDKFYCPDDYSKSCLYVNYEWKPEDLRLLNYTKLTFEALTDITYKTNTEVFDVAQSPLKIMLSADNSILLEISVDFKEKFFLKLKNSTAKLEVYMSLVDNIVDTNDLGFFKAYVNDYEWAFSPQEMEEEVDFKELSYKMVKVKDDKGFIFSEFSENMKFQKSNIYSKKNPKDKNPGIAFASISFDKVMKHYDRVYKKLQNVFADLGGLFNTFLLFGNLFIINFNNKRFNYDIINFLFHPEEEEGMNENGNSFLKHFNLKIEKRNNNSNNNKINFNNSFFFENNFYKNKLNDDCNDNNKSGIKNKCNISDKRNFNNGFSVFSKTENNFTCRMQKSFFIEESAELKNSNNILNENSSFNTAKFNNIKNNNNNNNNNNHCGFSAVEDKSNFIRNKNNCITIEKNKSNKINLNLGGGLKEKDLELKIQKYLNIEKQTKRKFIKFSKSEFSKSFLCCDKLKSEALVNKEKIFTSAETKIMDYFDILNYTKFHEEFEKLKSLIFDEYQLYAFEFTKNRKISEILRQNLNKGIFESVKHYEKQIKTNDLNELDLKLFTSINNKFLGLLDL